MLNKRFFRTKSYCNVTFQLSKEVIESLESPVQSAYLVGDFNEWDETATPLKKIKGVWKTTLQLEKDQEFQFRYLINGTKWHNDWEADRYVPNNVDGDNSVVLI